MGGEERTATMEELLAQTGWLRQLALRLAGDTDEAEDVVQETWIAAVRRSPTTEESVRPWLATVMRNALRMRARADGRRTAREQQTVLVQDEVPTPETLVAKAEIQRKLANLVLRLEEPYRSTVLLHYCEGVSLADIARSQGVAPSTARWRLMTALDQMREWLDDESGGKRRWLLMPLLALPKGAVVAEKSAKATAGAAALILVALLIGIAMYMTRDDDGGALDPEYLARAGLVDQRLRSAGDAPEDASRWLTQPGATARRVAGRVTFRGAPVSGATVELASLATESGIVDSPRRSTNANGEFDFGIQAAMEWSVRASANGKTGRAVAVDLRNPVLSPAPDELELELGACEAALVGTVRDASGGPLQGVRVARLPTVGVPAVPGGVSVTTDERGEYELCVDRMWPGQTRAEVSAAGYGAVGFDGIVYGRVSVDFMLVPEATIVGRVVRDDTGEPVRWAHVFVKQGPLATEFTAWRGTFTDDAGRFQVDQVGPGVHVVLARAEGMVGSPEGTAVTVDAGQTSNEIEIRLATASSLRGVVLDDGKPVAGARIAAIAADGLRGARTAVSQQDGSFSLDEVPRGDVQLTAWPYDVLAPKIVRVDRDLHDGIVVEVEPLGAIVGTVVHGGKPAAGVRVHLHGPEEWNLDPVFTDTDGRFAAHGLRPGPWVVDADSFRDGRFGHVPRAVQLAHGETEELVIELAYGAAIAGKVVDQHGAPVAGLYVSFWHTEIDDAGNSVTAEDGSFRATTMMGGGRYRVIIRPHGRSRELLRPPPGNEFPLIALADGESEVTGVVLTVQLDRLEIRGRVVDSSGASVPDARVSAAIMHGEAEPRFLRWIRRASATTDADGAFVIGDLQQGTYALQVRSPLGTVATASGARAGDHNVVLTLPTPGAIEGTLVGLGERAQVLAFPNGSPGEVVPSFGEVTGSSFAIRGLAPGEYSVAARGAAGAATQVVDVAAGSTARVTLSSRGTGALYGRVVEFSSGDPVEGMTCRANPRRGERPGGWFAAATARTDAKGAFALPDTPAGELVVVCFGLWRVYSQGVRLTELSPDEANQIEVPVVRWPQDVGATLSGFGADFDSAFLVPRLGRVLPNGPAANAGLRRGDRIVAIDGTAVTELSSTGILTLITMRPPGTTLSVTVTRGGEELTRDLVLGEGELW